MPLPQSSTGQCDFALITIKQKRILDNLFSKEDNRLMPPIEFREMILDMTLENGFKSFVRMLILSCGKEFLGRKCLSYIVSIVSDAEMEIIKDNHTSMAIDNDSSKLFEISDRNVQDPNIQGTVVF